MSEPRVPSLLLGLVFVITGAAYLLDSGPTGPTALVLLLVGLGAAALLALALRRGSSTEGHPEKTRPPDA